MNWSLIQGKELFYTHFFKYESGVDNGPVVDVQIFGITPFDTCHSLHLKNVIAMIQLCARHLPDLLEGTATLTPQSGKSVNHYPKRTEKDGLIYWFDDTRDIYISFPPSLNRFLEHLHF